MPWYYASNGAAQGPIEAAEMQRLRETNVVAGNTPVWTEGIAEWVPFEQSPLIAAAGTAGGAGAMHACAECRKVFPEGEMLHYENSWVCPTCKPVFFQRLREGVAVPGTLNYASVGKRFGAIFIDGLIIGFLVILPIMVVSVMMAASSHVTGESGMPGWLMPVLMIVEYVLPAAYEIFFIGKYGATLGKMAMKIKVTTPEGNPISYGRSTGRYFAKILSGIILYIGFFMACWDDEKRTLHDRICQTRVIALPRA